MSPFTARPLKTRSRSGAFKAHRSSTRSSDSVASGSSLTTPLDTVSSASHLNNAISFLLRYVGLAGLAVANFARRVTGTGPASTSATNKLTFVDLEKVAGRELNYEEFTQSRYPNIMIPWCTRPHSRSSSLQSSSSADSGLHGLAHAALDTTSDDSSDAASVYSDDSDMNPFFSSLPFNTFATGTPSSSPTSPADQIDPFAAPCDERTEASLAEAFGSLWLAGDNVVPAVVAQPDVFADDDASPSSKWPSLPCTSTTTATVSTGATTSRARPSSVALRSWTSGSGRAGSPMSSPSTMSCLTEATGLQYGGDRTVLMSSLVL